MINRKSNRDENIIYDAYSEHFDCIYRPVAIANK